MRHSIFNSFLSGGYSDIEPTIIEITYFPHSGGNGSGSSGSEGSGTGNAGSGSSGAVVAAGAVVAGTAGGTVAGTAGGTATASPAAWATMEAVGIVAIPIVVGAGLTLYNIEHSYYPCDSITECMFANAGTSLDPWAADKEAAELALANEKSMM